MCSWGNEFKYMGRWSYRGVAFHSVQGNGVPPGPRGCPLQALLCSPCRVQQQPVAWLRAGKLASLLLLVSMWFPAAVIPLSVQAPVERQRVTVPPAAVMRVEGWGGGPGTEEGT